MKPRAQIAATVAASALLVGIGSPVYIAAAAPLAEQGPQATVGAAVGAAFEHPDPAPSTTRQLHDDVRRFTEDAAARRVEASARIAAKRLAAAEAAREAEAEAEQAQREADEAADQQAARHADAPAQATQDSGSTSDEVAAEVADAPAQATHDSGSTSDEPADEPADEVAAEVTDVPAQATQDSGATSDEPADEGPTLSANVPSDLQHKVELAIEDTVAQTGATEADIEVELAERVTWRDGSLGCPKPGGMYTQALVEGYHIILTVGGDQRAYHGRDGAAPFYCSDLQEPLDGSASSGRLDR